MHAEQKPIVFEHEHLPPNSTGMTSLIFLIMLGLTCVALMVGFANDLGPLKIYANLGVACVQALVVSLFSMELKNQDKLTWLTAAASIFWTAILFLFVLTDYLTRGLTAW